MISPNSIFGVLLLKSGGLFWTIIGKMMRRWIVWSAS